MTTYRLTRNVLDRVLGGVCGGIGFSLGISGWWIRVAFIALTLVAPVFGLLTYVLLWMLIPGQVLTDLPPIFKADQERQPRYARAETMLILGGLAVVIGITVLAQSAGFTQGPQGDLLGPSLLALIAVVLLVKQIRGRA